MRRPDSAAKVDCDVLVIGSGAAGLSAAVTAAQAGLRVIVAEKSDVLGGATAWSGGWMWVPRNPLAQRAGIIEDIEAPRRYLKNVLGRYFNSERVEAFLANAPEMVRFFEEKTRLQFADGNTIPDIYAHQPGAATGGRQVIAAAYDAREVGPLLNRLRRTMRETAFLGMPIMAGSDLKAFLSFLRKPSAFFHVARRFSRHLLDLAVHGRAMQLVNGVALVARLAKSAEDFGVDFWTSAPAVALCEAGGRVTGAMIECDGVMIDVSARRGVILATGGFANDPARRATLFHRASTARAHLPLPPESVAGDGMRMAEKIGLAIEADVASPVAWAPVSLVHWRDGTTGHFPHIIDRGKPGMIAVLSNGRRFVNEATGYHDYTAAMVDAVPEGEPVRSWLICDHRALRRYGLGIVRPAPIPFSHWLRTGYLKRGATLADLATQCGIDADGLAATVAAYNEDARNGLDREMGRGSTPYNRNSGDAEQRPNPNVAPIERGPFYAVKIEPGCFGTFAGLPINGDAQVLGPDQAPVSGLYAVGGDAVSVMGGYYPSGGINLGPAMVFGYIAGRHCISRAVPTPSPAHATARDSQSGADGKGEQ